MQTQQSDNNNWNSSVLVNKTKTLQNPILWACDCEQWAHEHEQVSQSESFQGISCWCRQNIFWHMGWNIWWCGHGWMIFLDEKMDEFLLKMDAKPMKNHGWRIISLIKGGIISCWFYPEKYNTWNVGKYFKLYYIFSQYEFLQHLNHLKF
jgi:hypothetical protein